MAAVRLNSSRSLVTQSSLGHSRLAVVVSHYSLILLIDSAIMTSCRLNMHVILTIYHTIDLYQPRYVICYRADMPLHFIVKV